MTNKTKFAIVFILTGFVFLLVWLVKAQSTSEIENKQKTPPSFISSNWDKSFELISKDPNGLYLFNYLLKAGIDKNVEVAKIDHPYSLDTIPTNSNPTFIFIGDEFVLSEQEIDSLLARVNHGAKVFLAQHSMNRNIYNRLFDNIELSYEYGLSTKVRTEQNEYTFYRIFQSDTIANKWKGYRNILTFGQQAHKVISSINELDNNIAVPYGKGCIYLCSTPELFVNYQLKRKEGFQYSRTWLNRIPSNENIYWLELGRFVKDTDQPDEESDDDGSEKRDDSYLQFIFQKKQLVYAMILAIIGFLLFLLFRSKRTQPLVPIIPKKKNMSLEFADTITSIYFHNNNPFVLLNIQKKNFYEAVHKHFFVDLSKRNEDKEIITLSQKSNISQAVIQDIIEGFETTSISSVDENYLLQQSNKYLSFYNQAGMITEKVQAKLSIIRFKLYRSFTMSAILLMIGAFTIIVGLYFLVQSIGVGIILWPIGAAITAIAILRLSKPLITVNDQTIINHTLFGKEQKHMLGDLNHIDINPTGCTFVFHGDKQLTINYSELTNLDAQQLKQFVLIQNKLKL